MNVGHHYYQKTLSHRPGQGRWSLTSRRWAAAKSAAGRDDHDKPMRTDLKAAFRQISVFRRHCTDPDHTLSGGGGGGGIMPRWWWREGGWGGGGLMANSEVKNSVVTRVMPGRGRRLVYIEFRNKVWLRPGQCWDGLPGGVGPTQYWVRQGRVTMNTAAGRVFDRISSVYFQVLLPSLTESVSHHSPACPFILL